MNVMFVTLDQFRADCLSVAGHPLVETPNLDRLAATGVRFASHFGQAAPCAPGRASLYTGMYQMNHRVVANGTPLEHRFDNVARVGRRAGFAPALFGYTDQGVDPSTVSDPTDPRLDTYEGVLPGFDAVLPLDGRMGVVGPARRPRLRHVDARPGARDRARPAGRAQRLGLPDRRAAGLDRPPGRTVVRPRQLPPAPPALRGGRSVGHA